MATAEFLIQAVTTRHHASEITRLLALPKPVACVLSVAFARTAGIGQIEGALKALKIKPKVLVGIRNDITSVQALRQLITLGVELYTVDTGSRRPIFHPKLYLISSKSVAKVIIGSANLTRYGLLNNIEASALLLLDLKNAADAKFVDEIYQSLNDIVTNHPAHVQQIKSTNDVEALFEQGRVCDEEVVVAPSSAQKAPKTGGIQLNPMKLFRGVPTLRAKKPSTKRVPVKNKNAGTLSKTQFVRVWQSKPLVPRDLSVPDGNNTNLTGSIGLKQDVIEDFDFQTHFRQVIFAELSWSAASKEPLKEEAMASFQFLIENVDYGTFDLKVAHDNRKNTTSYLQRNFMTQLHWGLARSIIARRDLIGRTLLLYKKDSTPPTYLIEID